MCCPGGEFQKLRLRGVKPMDEMQRKIAAERSQSTCGCVAYDEKSCC